MPVHRAGKKGIRMNYIFLLFLLVCAVWDVRTQKIPSIWIYGGLVWMGIYAFCQIIWEKRGMMDLIFAVLPGVICYFFSKISQAMGDGDALLILGTGLCYSTITVLKILMSAFFLSALGSIVFLLIKRNIKNRNIPFVPYLLFACVFLLTG